jgi:hypothetical protein
MTLVPAGEDPGDAPSKEHREGFRLIIKVLAVTTATAPCGNFCRRQSRHGLLLIGFTTSTSVTPTNTRPAAGCDLMDVIETKNASGTSFRSALQIVDWVDRPADMPEAARRNGSKTHRAVVASTAGAARSSQGWTV